MTRIPPPNKTIKPIFLSGLRLAFQSIGNGIDNKYTSVMTLNARYTQTTWAETAGWQTSGQDWVSDTSRIVSRCITYLLGLG
jgi:hypothetical protein